MAETKKLLFLSQLSAAITGLWTKVKTLVGTLADTADDGTMTVKAAALPVASATAPGAVKIGSGLTIAADGTISASATTPSLEDLGLSEATDDDITAILAALD